MFLRLQITSAFSWSYACLVFGMLKRGAYGVHTRSWVGCQICFATRAETHALSFTLPAFHRC